MVETFIEMDAMSLVKDAIKYGLKFREGENSLSKKLFLSQTSQKAAEGKVTLNDFVQIMLDQEWKSQRIWKFV